MKTFIGLLIGFAAVLFFMWEPALEMWIGAPSSSGSSAEKVLIDVPRGATLGRVSDELVNKGLIGDSRLFRLYARLKGLSHSLKVGEYEVPRSSKPGEILAILSSGRSKLYSLTFPEGANIFEMAWALDRTEKFSGAEFLKMVRDPKYIEALLGERFLSLEGYLFPETYNYTKYTSLDELIRSMVRRFEIVFNEVSEGYSGRMSKNQVVILASVIEKETGAPEERAMIGSVFHNRLNRGMRLQSDPTIIYGHWAETGEPLRNIRKNDILRPTPHNTYTVKALPAGPVANPGREALRAAMFPETSEYLFFVSRNDGTHIFTKNYKDHLQAVRDFQLDPRAREGKSWRDLRSKSQQ